jgi:hypothetical protein
MYSSPKDVTGSLDPHMVHIPAPNHSAVGGRKLIQSFVYSPRMSLAASLLASFWSVAPMEIQNRLTMDQDQRGSRQGSES